MTKKKKKQVRWVQQSRVLYIYSTYFISQLRSRYHTNMQSTLLYRTVLRIYRVCLYILLYSLLFVSEPRPDGCPYSISTCTLLLSQACKTCRDRSLAFALGTLALRGRVIMYIAMMTYAKTLPSVFFFKLIYVGMVCTIYHLFYACHLLYSLTFLYILHSIFHLVAMYVFYFIYLFNYLYIYYLIQLLQNRRKKLGGGGGGRVRRTNLLTVTFVTSRTTFRFTGLLLRMQPDYGIGRSHIPSAQLEHRWMGCTPHHTTPHLQRCPIYQEGLS